MPRWVRAAAVADCLPGRGVECVVEGRVVALFNVNGTFHALDGVCSHQGGPLAEGRLQGCVVTCPWHGWPYDVTTGQHQWNRTMLQPRFATRVEGDEVLIDLDGPPPAT